MANKTIKYRLYPNKQQKELINKTFGCCRKIWNVMLADRIEYYKQNSSKLNNTPAQYKGVFPFLKEVDSLALANVQLNLNTAYNNFFRDKKIGFPKFKSRKHCKKRYTTNFVNSNIKLGSNYLKLPKIGSIKAKIHRTPNSDWKLKSVTLECDATNCYYASVLFEYEQSITPILIKNELALDYKSDGLYYSSDNTQCNMDHFYRKQEKKLRIQQHKLSRKSLKSQNYYKQRLKVAKIHKKISNQRKDFLHKKSTEIANLCDAVYVENLNLKSISNKGFKNGKATLDNAYGLFLNMLKYKLEDQCKTFIKIDKWYPSSQICSNCGQIHKEMKNLALRTLVCDCGLKINRDYNAALNIKKEGHKIAFAI